MSEKSIVPTSAGSKRLTDSSVVGEPLDAVPAAQSIDVRKMDSGSFSLTRM